MKYEQYISLIESLEAQASGNRRLYELKVFLLTMLGYAYFIGVILLCFVPFVVVAAMLWAAPAQIARIVLVTAKLWWALIPGLGIYFGFIGSAARSITASVPDPKGIEIKRADAPELFDFVDRTCRSLRAKRPEKVLVTDSFNAAVATLPRFGIFGQKVVLLLGLPVMKALSPEQFKAVLVHEIGHISGKHGSSAKWAYQMREAWGRLIDSQAENNHKFGGLYKGFVNWFFPYFTAFSFVLMRGQEVDADREAASLTGAQALGEALVLMEAKGRAVNDDFWRGVQDENIQSDTPPQKIFTRMLGSLAFIDERQAGTSLAKAITVPTDHSDTHPSLADRLRLIGYWTVGDVPPIPTESQVDAAHVFLGSSAERIASDFDTEWDEQAGREWKTRHEHFQQSKKRVQELHEKREKEDLSLEELMEIAEKIADTQGLADAYPILKEAAEKFPNEANVWYSLGSVRLTLDDEAGLADLERAAEIDSKYKLAANDTAFAYLRSKGRVDEAKEKASYLEEQNEIFEKADRERAAVYPNDQFEIHELPAEFIDQIPKKLGGLEEITAIYAVRKVVQYLPEYPYHVLFIEVRKKGRFRNRHDADPSAILKIVVDRLSTGEIQYFALLNGKFAGVKHYLDRIPGAKIYPKA